MPFDPADYHPDWEWIRLQVMEQDGWTCAMCGVPHNTYVVRIGGEWMPAAAFVPGGIEGMRVTFVILTTAHLDHDRGNNEPSNLRALCQACHLNWDRSFHLRQRSANRRSRRLAAGQGQLL